MWESAILSKIFLEHFCNNIVSFITDCTNIMEQQFFMIFENQNKLTIHVIHHGTTIYESNRGIVIIRLFIIFCFFSNSHLFYLMNVYFWVIYVYTVYIQYRFLYRTVKIRITAKKTYNCNRKKV